MTYFGNLSIKWNEWFYESADPRIRDYPLMGSPWPMLFLCFMYLVVIKIIMPKIMEERKPLNTKKVLWWCNLWHLVASSVFFYRASAVGWLTTYSWRCEPINPSVNEETIALVQLCYHFFLFKFSYMMESVIHVLGKRSELISTYHLVHHSTLPVSVWAITNYLPGGHATFFGWLNPGFHIIIFGYLVVIGIFPQWKVYTRWWKTFHMWLQVSQLFILFMHSFQLLLWNYCEFPMLFIYIILGHTSVIFLSLFL